MIKMPVSWLCLFLMGFVLGDTISEYGSYSNPHPRPHERCSAPDLIKLSTCCNNVLTKLDICKADDLACECCALQSMDQECFSLCPGDPSNNFLSVLYNDCSSLNDINACSLPFRKTDTLPKKTKQLMQKFSPIQDIVPDENRNNVVLKSKLSPKVPSQIDLLDILNVDEDEEEHKATKEDQQLAEPVANSSAAQNELSKSKAHGQHAVNGTGAVSSIGTRFKVAQVLPLVYLMIVYSVTW